MRASDADNPTDEALVRRIGAGDRGACAPLVDRHLRRVHALAWRMLGNDTDAEEVAQDVFLRVWQHAARWRPQAKFSTWLHQVTLNACRDRLRRRRDADDIDDHAPADLHAASIEQDLQRDAVGAQVRAAIGALPARQREALLLVHFQELPQAEAAAVLDISVDALESLLARARRGLRERLQGVREDLTGELP